jgi:hypothetical protein
MPSGPTRVRWTDHALEKAAPLGITRTDVEQVVIEHHLREIDPSTGRIVGLEYWHASTALPQDLLTLLPPPGVAAAL